MDAKKKKMCKWSNKYFQPSSSLLLFPSLAGESLQFLAARVALHQAAPVELAVALPDARVALRVEAPAAAHQAAAVRQAGVAAAWPAPRARAARGPVLLAVVGRALQVDQVHVRGLLVPLSLFQPQEGGLPEPGGSHRLNLDGAAVALLQQVADLSELGQGDPAGPGGAGTRHSVALTLQLHPLLKDLRKKLRGLGFEYYPFVNSRIIMTFNDHFGSSGLGKDPYKEILISKMKDFPLMRIIFPPLY